MTQPVRSLPLLDKVKLAAAVAKVRLTGRFVPLLVGWSITDRCQFQCSYCGLCGDGANDLPTEKILHTVDALADLGCRRIQFTGGEPLLREDLADILERCNVRRIATSVSTNGVLVGERIDMLKLSGQVNLSLDGEKAIQDKVRGPGAFEAVMVAAEALKSANIPFRFNAVLHSESLPQIEFLIRTARSYGTFVTFQPVTLQVLGQTNENVLAPRASDYKKAVDALIVAHRSGEPVGNSLPGLMHLRQWPDSSPILCVGGRIFMRIEADGGILNCQRRGGKYDANLGDHPDVKAAIGSVRAVGCTQCWSAPVVEAAMVMRGRLSTILHLNRTL